MEYCKICGTKLDNPIGHCCKNEGIKGSDNRPGGSGGTGYTGLAAQDYLYQNGIIGVSKVDKEIQLKQLEKECLELQIKLEELKKGNITHPITYPQNPSITPTYTGDYYKGVIMGMRGGM